MTMPRYRLGVDVGGTHTDLVLYDVTTGALLVEKVASTPHNPAAGVLDGIANFVRRGVDPAEIDFFAHGTTITTNALLEMRGAKVGLLITKGYRAVQEIQNQARDGNLFDYFYEKPVPIAPQSLTREIAERSDYLGNVLVALDREAVRRAARELKAAGVQFDRGLLPVLLHEPGPRAGDPQAHRGGVPGRPCLAVERGAAAGARMAAALDHPGERLSGAGAGALHRPSRQGLDAAGVRTRQRFLMQSNGGVMPFAAAIAGGKTVHTLLSGPAAGAQAAAYLAREDAKRGLVTLDMGGTSADIAFIEGGAPLEVTEGVISRRQVDVPALDLTTISAGGGSIAAVDGGGFLTVGPTSAGADPGPACYGRGGTQPTVTDADLVCGFLNPDYFLGGLQKLDVAASQDGLAAPRRRAAAHERARSRRRHPPHRRHPHGRRGAGVRGEARRRSHGVHAAAVRRRRRGARGGGRGRTRHAAHPGAAAAGRVFGAGPHLHRRGARLYALGAQAPRRHQRRSCRGDLRGARSEGAQRTSKAEGLNAGNARYSRELDLRYAGQGYELRTPLDGLFVGRVTAATLAGARVRFDERHAQIHGHSAKDRPVEIVSYRLRLRVAVPKFEQREEAVVVAGPAEPARKGERAVCFDGARATPATLYERDRLDPGAMLAGPAIVEQFDATTAIPPGWHATVDGFRNLVLSKREA